MIKDKILIGVCSIGMIIIVILGINLYTVSNHYSDLQTKYQKTTKLVQISEDALILLDDWYKADGYVNASSWWADYINYKDFLSTAKERVETSINASYVSDEQLVRLEQIQKESNESRNVTQLKQLRQEFDEIINNLENIKQEQENAAVMDLTPYYESYSNYTPPSDGLTQWSGVNYHDGRTETYYSSNVLYHYRTNEWTLDDEGFYRTNEGYYVVAASDKEQGTTFETSKGTAIVLDSGCSEGVTDFYVAW